MDTSVLAQPARVRARGYECAMESLTVPNIRFRHLHLEKSHNKEMGQGLQTAKGGASSVVSSNSLLGMLWDSPSAR